MSKRKKGKAKKRPKSAHNPTAQKTPKIKEEQARSIESAEQKKPAWRISKLDKDCPKWGWTGIDKETVWGVLHPKLAQFETMTWEEIQQKGSHYVMVSRLIPEARRRLKDIKLDDYDQLFSLRLAGKQRIWGIKERNIFSLLWWDPQHKVCPSTKKHT